VDHRPFGPKVGQSKRLHTKTRGHIMDLYGGCAAGLGAASALRIESEMDLARL
jgi:hypothetical protein